jgi:hypothetical protein
MKMFVKIHIFVKLAPKIMKQILVDFLKVDLQYKKHCMSKL